jgi:hypothetical protein
MKWQGVGESCIIAKYNKNDQIKEGDMGMESSMNGAKRKAYRILVGKSQLGIPRCRWVDNIKLNLREIEWGGMGCSDLAQDSNWQRVLQTR